MIFMGIFLDGHRANSVCTVVFAFRAEKSCPMSYKDEKETNERRGCPSSLERLQVPLYDLLNLWCFHPLELYGLVL